MTLFDSIGLILLAGAISIALYLVAMVLGVVAEWLVLWVKDHAAHR